jgi:hypothetical protein
VSSVELDEKSRSVELDEKSRNDRSGYIRQKIQR